MCSVYGDNGVTHQAKEKVYAKSLNQRYTGILEESSGHAGWNTEKVMQKDKAIEVCRARSLRTMQIMVKILYYSRAKGITEVLKQKYNTSFWKAESDLKGGKTREKETTRDSSDLSQNQSHPLIHSFFHFN